MDRYRLYDRAYELAASGQHIDCITIVATLTSDGFMEAADALANEELRSELRKICQQLWRHDRSNQETGPSAPTYPVRE